MMGVSQSGCRGVALVSRDREFVDGLSEWLGHPAASIHVVLSVGSWADLLNAPGFPTDLVVLDAAVSRRPLESKVRTLRTAGAAVIVVTDADDLEAGSKAVTAGAFCVLAKTVPFGLIAEMANGALGLPLAGGVA